MTSHGYDVKISSAPYRRYKYSCRDERQYICRTTQICSRATRLHRCTSSYIPAARPFAISLIIPDDSARPGLFGICNLHWLEFLRRNRYESPCSLCAILQPLREFVNDRRVRRRMLRVIVGTREEGRSRYRYTRFADYDNDVFDTRRASLRLIFLPCPSTYL